MRLTLVISILLAAVPAGEARATPPEAADTVIYRVKRGDSLYELARRYFQRASDYAVVQRLNAVREPRRLATYRTLAIPRRLLRYQPIKASVIAFRGQVQILRASRPVRSAVGAIVAEGDLITTLDNSFISLKLPDGSTVVLPSQTSVRIERLRRIDLTGAVDRLFKLLAGRARAIVTPRSNDDDRFQIVTPVSVSAVRGTEFRVSYDGQAARSGTEVLHGVVNLGTGAPKDAIDVHAGSGAVASRAGTTEHELLPAPKLLEPDKIQDEDATTFAIERMPAASRYHAAIAADAGFLDVLLETFAAEPKAEFASVPDGTWFVRLSAVDASGLEGLPATYSFERRLGTIETQVEQRRVRNFREYLFRWRARGEDVRQYRFQLFRDSLDSVPVVDEIGLTRDNVVVTDLAPGEYLWRVMTLQVNHGKPHTKWSPAERLTISGAK